MTTSEQLVYRICHWSFLSLWSYANSKLTSQYFDSRLKTITTARNWRTVLNLQGMARTT